MNSKYIKIFLLIILICNQNVKSADWVTIGGNNQRNGNTNVIGPVSSNTLWNKPSLYSIWGNQTYIFGNRIVTTRYVSLSPIKAPLACHDLLTGDSLWTRNYAENGVMIVMGFRDNKIYARNFQQQGFDTIYAINPENGNVIWKSIHTVERGIIWSAAFASNGDLLLPGSGNKSVMRINHLNGDTVWTRYRIIPNTGAECMCVYGNTLYTFEGGITTAKRVMAIDVNSGVIKYYSNSLPGDGDQEIPFSIGLNGDIYVVRDGGNMHSLRDNGSGFSERWNVPLRGNTGTYSQFGISSDSSVYIPSGKRIYRINHVNGAFIDSTEELISSGTLNARMAIDSEGKVFVSNGASDPVQGKNLCFTRNLNTVWSIDLPYNYYSGPALGQNGILVFCGGGTNIMAFQNPVSVSNLQTESAKGFRLYQNFPNPFNPNTIISFELQSATGGMSYVSLKIYDISGKEVALLVNEFKSPGNYKVEFDARLAARQESFTAGGLPSGVYFYKLNVGDFSETKRMILQK